MPRVSILMPCRNAAGTLPETIASLQGQTWADYEVVAVDDGSEDATPDILLGWAGQDPRVRVLRAHGAGIVAALDLGFAETRAPILARMDADDIARPRRLEQQLALLDAEPRIAACGTGVRYFPDDFVRGGARRYEAWLNSLTEPDDIARDIFVECPIAHPTLMIRRDVLLDVGGYRDLGWPEDYDLVLRLWAAGHRLANVPDILLDWREAERRTSRVDPRYSPEAFRRLKVDVLVRTLLARRDGAVVWGAGPVGKAFARELRAHGVPLRAFVDLDPRKIGQRIHGAPVIAPTRIDRFRDALILGAVGQPRAREEIRQALRAAGRVEMQDFCMVA